MGKTPLLNKIYHNAKILFLLSIALIITYYYFYSKEGFQTEPINKTVWLLWLQGWENAPWLPQQVKTSWEIQNPGWTIQLVSEENLKTFLPELDYVYRDTITPQAKSDIIRLSLLSQYGGVWADASLLCMKPLDSWVYDAIQPSGIWMYHGNGANMDIRSGPASWFIVSVKNSYIITKWKNACDSYWQTRSSTGNYFWMDYLFKELYETDPEFKQDWDRVPYIFCEDKGQSHIFSDGSWKDNTPELKELINTTPPHVMKLWITRWNEEFPDINTQRARESNGFHAIQYATKSNW
jgi:mannosyltransferase OCH1-like enzyme